MAFTPINNAEIAVGNAVKKELFEKVKDNFDDHESRISALSLGAAPVVVFHFDVVNASSASTLTGLCHYEAIAAFTLTTVKVQIFETGSIVSGILEIDVKKSTTDLDDANFSSVLTTLPSIDFSTAVDYDSDLGVLDGVAQSVGAGDYLRLDVTSLPSLPLGKFRVLVYGTL